MKPGLHSQPSTHRFWQAMPENPEWQVAGHTLAHSVYVLLGGQVIAGGRRSRGEKGTGQDREKGTKQKDLGEQTDPNVSALLLCRHALVYRAEEKAHEGSIKGTAT